MHAHLADSDASPGSASVEWIYQAGLFCACCGEPAPSDRPERASAVFVRTDGRETERRVYHLCPDCLLVMVGEFEKRHEAAFRRLLLCRSTALRTDNPELDGSGA